MFIIINIGVIPGVCSTKLQMTERYNKQGVITAGSRLMLSFLFSLCFSYVYLPVCLSICRSVCLSRRGSRIFCRGGQRRPCTAGAFGARADGGSRVDKHQIKVHSVHRIFRASLLFFLL